MFKKNNKIKDVKDLCRVWQKQSLDGFYQNYPDLVCIVFNLKYQKYLKTNKGKHSQYREESFLKGSKVDFYMMTETIECVSCRIRQLNTHIRARGEESERINPNK